VTPVENDDTGDTAAVARNDVTSRVVSNAAMESRVCRLAPGPKSAVTRVSAPDPATPESENVGRMLELARLSLLRNAVA
jgi:hypothetical protein